MPYVGREANSFTTVVDVTVSDDLTVTDDATIGGALSAKGGAVFNEDSADVDFRVESNGNANMLFVDGGNDVVGIGNGTAAAAINTASGLGNLVVGSGSGVEGITIYSGSDTYAGLNFADATSGGGAYAGYIKFDHTNNFFAHFIGNTERMRISSGGDIDVKTGDIFFSTAGKGIVLGATSNTDANTLDDYEEGTWTPAFSGADTNTGASSSGSYVKIGQLVHCTFNIVQTALTGTGTATMTGLPFACANVINASAFAVQDMGHLLNVVTTDNGRFRCVGNAATLQGVKSLGGTTFMNYNELYDGSGNLEIKGAFSYRST